VFLEENHLVAIMIGQGMPEAKLHPHSALIGAWPEMTRSGASPRTAMFGNTAAIGMTSGTLLKIGGVSETEHQIHLDDS
jgi:hypothetical protein